MLELLRLVTAEPEDRRAAIAARLESGSATNVPMLKAAAEGSGVIPSAWTMLSTLRVSRIILTVAACRDEFAARRRRIMKELAQCPLTLKLI
jgi:hypothetical protein